MEPKKTHRTKVFKMGYHDGYNEISGRPLDAGDMISDEGDGVPHALKELTKVHRPDLVDYLPEFWRKFNALSEPAEDPNQERIDLNKNDIDIIQIQWGLKHCIKPCGQYQLRI